MKIIPEIMSGKPINNLFSKIDGLTEKLLSVSLTEQVGPEDLTAGVVVHAMTNALATALAYYIVNSLDIPADKKSEPLFEDGIAEICNTLNDLKKEAIREAIRLRACAESNLKQP